MNPIYFFDLLGTLAFAFFGAYLGIKKHLDIFGVFCAAFLTAVGGGTIRELILNRIPAYFFDWHYILIILAGLVLALICYPVFNKINKYALIVDAIGLSTFAYIGAQKAYETHMGIFGIIFLATISAVGGGIIRDIAIREVPQIFYSDFYASPAIILGAIFAFLNPNQISDYRFIYGLIAFAFILRILAINFKIGLWKPWSNI